MALQVKIEVYVDHNNKVVSNSPLVLPTAEIPHAAWLYEDVLIKARKQAADVAKKSYDKAVGHYMSTHKLFHLLEEIEASQVSDLAATPATKRARLLEASSSNPRSPSDNRYSPTRPAYLPTDPDYLPTHFAFG